MSTSEPQKTITPGWLEFICVHFTSRIVIETVLAAISKEQSDNQSAWVVVSVEFHVA